MLSGGRRVIFIYFLARIGSPRPYDSITFVVPPVLLPSLPFVPPTPIMEAPLRCNNTTCRAKLTERAVVTTCSHIFCPPCADETGLSRSIQAQRKCPACNAFLSNPDDAVTTTLQPTEDYKTSVLSGLDPSTIMECAGRALAFWTYQSTQEM